MTATSTRGGRFGPIPLVVAAVGHLDLRDEDRPALAQLAREIIGDLVTTYPNTRVEILSSLAEGADRLLAGVALEVGAHLVVPLPMPVDEYRKDFPDAASIEEFERLLARAERAFVVVPSPPDDSTLRPQCYARTAAYLAVHCQLLIALWDGVDSGRPGGTAQAVHFRLHGVPAPFTTELLHSVDTGLVCQIVTPRRAGTVPTALPLTVSRLAPGRRSLDEAESAFRKVAQSIEKFNGSAAKVFADASVARGVGWEALVGGVTPGHPDSPPHVVAELYAYADRLALQLQRRTRGMLVLLLGLAYAAVGALTVFSEWFPHLSWIMGLYVAFVALGYGCYWSASKRQIDARYWEYRALAEGLRVQFYWQLAGVRDSVADHYLRRHCEDLEWIRSALRECEPRHAATGVTEEWQLRVVLARWACGQRDYFRQAVSQEHQRLTRLRRQTTCLLTIGLASGLLLTGVAYVPWLHALHEAVERSGWVHSMAVTIVVMASAGAALLHGYGEKRAYEAHIRRYRRVMETFDVAVARLGEQIAARDWARAAALVRELGRESLQENGDWVALHRDRPLEVPQ